MENKNIIIRIPESESLQKANLSDEDIERMVKSMFEGIENPGFSGVTIQGGPLKGDLAAPADWEKSWDRAC